MKKKLLPIGIDDFEKLITKGYYFVDKTMFIQELIDKKGDVNLFTRPRRFGNPVSHLSLKSAKRITLNTLVLQMRRWPGSARILRCLKNWK